MAILAKKQKRLEGKSEKGGGGVVACDADENNLVICASAKRFYYGIKLRDAIPSCAGWVFSWQNLIGAVAVWHHSARTARFVLYNIGDYGKTVEDFIISWKVNKNRVSHKKCF